MFQHSTIVAFILVGLTDCGVALTNVSIIEFRPWKVETVPGPVPADNESLESQACIL